MDGLDFLTGGRDATAVLIVRLPDGSVSHIANVSPLRILDKCPLLYHSLEFGYGFRQASIEASSRYAVVSLLRYIYTSSYLEDNEPSFLLNHVETFKIAENYDVPELQLAAYVNFSRQTEFSCSLKDPPVLLCETIRFLYQDLDSHRSRREQSLVDTLLNYCLAVFAYQGLGERADFRRVVFDLPAFHRDLCRTSMQREFLDEGALDIVRLPVSSPTPHSYDILHKRALGDFQFELWKDFEDPSWASENTVEESSAKRRKPDDDGAFTLVRRSKDLEGMPTYSEAESGNESSTDGLGFTLVHHPVRNVNTAAARDSLSSYPSSPELVCATPPNVRTAPQSETYANISNSLMEEDWSFV